MHLLRWLALILLLPVALASAAYVLTATNVVPDRYNPLTPLDLAERPNPITGIKLWLMSGNHAACVSALRRAGVAFQEMPTRSEGPYCLRRGTVTIGKFSAATLEPEEMNCGMALRLYLLERHDIQPLARSYFGAGVERIHHFGSYSCRKIRGGSSMSEHTTANAFDLAGFRLSNGRTVSLKQDWQGSGPASAFLHEVRTRACLLFNMVLSPDYNTDHADHFHFDMGWLMGCH